MLLLLEPVILDELQVVQCAAGAVYVDLQGKLTKLARKFPRIYQQEAVGILWRLKICHLVFNWCPDKQHLIAG